MDKTRVSRASVQCMLLALAGWVYAQSHAVGEAEQAWGQAVEVGGGGGAAGEVGRLIGGVAAGGGMGAEGARRERELAEGLSLVVPEHAPV
ncbi:hypothetical protein BCR44DRAFT_1437534 [Catenaria anguillulae PL171]|uniref:Uncharacterized protein n=1 Tax=Catenaria anguillulae PL171 TaxID=765915 RepID=A0A1Y2HJ72_9FUNG|nr:hypothetical protein BCR44DRAFT_1437534 [Catenaria anguillulae PL171]